MPALLLTFAAGMVGPRFAKAAVIGSGVVLLLLAIFAAVKLHDHRVIREHQAQQEAANAKADRKADANAADQRRADDARSAHESTQIKEAVNEARRTGADARAAYYSCVRAQQAARHAGQPSPAC